MNHVPPFQAIDDIVKDGEGHKVCICWGRNGNPSGGNQEAEKIAILLNQFGNRNIEVLKKMDADGVSVFELIDTIIATTNLRELGEKKHPQSSTPILWGYLEAQGIWIEIAKKLRKYGS